MINFKKKIQAALTISASSLLLAACGDVQLGKNINVHLDPATQTANAEIEMGSGMEMDIAGDFDIDKGKGKIYFVPATKTSNAKIGLQVNVLALANVQTPKLEKIEKLPSGSNLPVAMSAPLYGVKVANSSSAQITAAFQIVPELQIAGIIGVNKLNQKYVIPGFKLCQDFRNKEQVAIGAICVYGPSADNSKPGGFFIGANMGQVVGKNQNQLQKGMMLAASSSAFAISSTEASASEQLSLKAFSFNSDVFSYSLDDPKKQMNTSKGQKSYNNVVKYLKGK